MRIYPQDFCMSDAMPFQQHYECRTEFPIEKIVTDKDAFLSVRGNLRVGDRITICSYKKVNSKAGVSEGLTGIGNVRVADVTNKGVALVLEAPLIRVEEPKPEPVIAEIQNLNVKKVFGGGFAVMDDSGNTIEQFKTKVEAEEYARFNEAA